MSGLMEPPTQPLRKPGFSLVTPSASPPPRQAVTKSRPSTAPVPQLDKRSRVSSTPKPSQTSSSASSSARPTEEPIDYEKERKASASRLLDVWSQLAERYTRRLDEDDIVDIVTGKIVKDNGVLRKAKKMRFGDTHAPGRNEDDEAEESEEEDGQENQGGQPEDDDDDELDAFLDADNDHDDEEQPEVLEIHSRVEAVPPVTPQNPLDAADLKEFMETERLRRSVLGSEPEDDPDAYLSESESTDAGDITHTIQQRSEDDSEDELNSFLPEEVIPPELEGDVSEDEEDSDDEVEIIEVRPAKSIKQAPQKLPPPAIQLQTPPLSTTSVQPFAATPTEELFVSPGLDAWSPEIPVSDLVDNSHRKTPKTPAKLKQQPTPREKSKKPQIPENPKKLVPEVVIKRRTPFPTEPSSIPRLSSVAKAKGSDKKAKTPALPNIKPTVSTKPGSPTKIKAPEGTPLPTKSLTGTQKASISAQAPPSKPPPSVERKTSEISPSDTSNSHKSSPPASPRKRKRSLDLPKPTPSQPPTRPFPIEPLASSSKVQLEHLSKTRRDSSDNESPVRSKDSRRTIQQRSPRKRRSKSRSRPPRRDANESDSDSDGRQTPTPHRTYYNQQLPLYPYPPPPHLYPGPPPPPAQPHPHHQQSHQSRGFTPMADPQTTQYLVSQVLTALVGQWNPMAHGHIMPPPPPPNQHSSLPFTPSHLRMHPPEYNFSTPTHHPYPYPYPHPDWSRATAPPDTPDQSSDFSSPSSGSHGRRRKSIAHRSQSRGRNVAFREKKNRAESRARSRGRRSPSRSPRREQDDSDDEVDDRPSSPLKAKGASTSSRRRKSLSTSGRGHVSASSKPKGKQREVEDESLSESSGEEDDDDDRPLSERRRSKARSKSRGRDPGSRRRTPEPPDRSRPARAGQANDGKKVKAQKSSSLRHS
ncbi:hypothetical protein BKA70DRAFT_1264776 [Coprinopsis sp. MPI-PUGE-AT-0042]|nr:hypothetical protein BKA70DRAFT_1264776 [Coprinopsis sp. MPI-PUGE-AT-0042]